MMQKRLLALLMITVVVLGGGLYLSQHRSAEPDAAASGYLVPELNGKLNDINGLKVTGANSTVIAELKRENDAWVVASKNNHPADFTRVREYLIKLADARLREVKTSKPANYARLGVEDVTAADAKGIAIELAGLDQPVGVIVGISSGGGTPGTFVRRANVAESYLVSGDLVPEKEASNWLDKNILDVPAAQVRHVLITAPDGAKLEALKADPNAFNYAVPNLPKGAQLSSESAANLLAGVLASLALEDVVPAASLEPDPKPWTAQYRTYEGLIVDTTLWDKDDKSYARFTASVDEGQVEAWVAGEKTKADAARAAAQAAQAAAATKPAEDAKPGETPAIAASPADQAAALPPAFDPAKAKTDKRAELDKKVVEINTRTAAWTYVIPSWKAMNIKKKVADLLMGKDPPADQLPPPQP